jgi:hypothetical protein
MSEREEDIAASAEIIKAWFEEEQGSYIAFEDQIVHWNNDTEKVFQSTWINLKVKECVRIIRATRFPLGLMKYCTEDAVVSAAQELDRVYERAVSINGACPAHYFNYKVSTVNDPMLVVVVKLLEYTERQRWNILWRDLTSILDVAWGELGVSIPTPAARNRLIREAVRHTKYGAKQYTKGYNYQGKKHHCVKLDYVVGFEKEFDEAAMLKVARVAIKGSRLKRMSGMIVSDAEIAKTEDFDVSRFHPRL